MQFESYGDRSAFQPSSTPINDKQIKEKPICERTNAVKQFNQNNEQKKNTIIKFATLNNLKTVH